MPAARDPAQAAGLAPRPAVNAHRRWRICLAWHRVAGTLRGATAGGTHRVARN